ncbi:hypothetical protein N0V84_003339 [Fusarium piperis]|uniref:Uncharacterized protein n=1 Tax=Fusarium piperis TaxID=1435070 RepID=A0A9W8WHJ2_9HYPO|nr:hypothetical protein N0V84_003339 [Fusarium piperis]
MAQNTPSVEEPLTMKQFEPNIRAYVARPSAQQWRRGCVKKVIKAYEGIKASMSPATRHELYVYLRRGDWIRTARNPSSYALIRSLRGQIPTRGHGRLYYPHLFVVHAIWGPSDWVVKLLYEFSAHWGVLFDMDKLTYPKIDDPNKEYLLFLGKTPVKPGTGNQVPMPRNTHAMGEAPRHDRGPLPLRPVEGAGAPVIRKPAKPVQDATGQAVRAPPLQQNDIGIKQEVRRIDATNQPPVAQGTVGSEPANTKQAHAQPCHAAQGTT